MGNNISLCLKNSILAICVALGFLLFYMSLFLWLLWGMFHDTETIQEIFPSDYSLEAYQFQGFGEPEPYKLEGHLYEFSNKTHRRYSLDYAKSYARIGEHLCVLNQRGFWIIDLYHKRKIFYKEGLTDRDVQDIENNIEFPERENMAPLTQREKANIMLRTYNYAQEAKWRGAKIINHEEELTPEERAAYRKFPEVAKELKHIEYYGPYDRILLYLKMRVAHIEEEPEKAALTQIVLYMQEYLHIDLPGAARALNQYDYSSTSIRVPAILQKEPKEKQERSTLAQAFFFVAEPPIFWTICWPTDLLQIL